MNMLCLRDSLVAAFYVTVGISLAMLLHNVIIPSLARGAP
jgi:hypothetical protein